MASGARGDAHSARNYQLHTPRAQRAGCTHLPPFTTAASRGRATAAGWVESDDTIHPKRRRRAGGAAAARAPGSCKEGEMRTSTDSARGEMRTSTDSAPLRATLGAARPSAASASLISIALVSPRWRSLFEGLTHFNAMQSRVYEVAVHSDHCIALSAPTGSGKTHVFNMAILRFLLQRSGEVPRPPFRTQPRCAGGGASLATSKCVYLTPTKALASERARDWTARLPGLRVMTLTGDSDEDAGGVHERWRCADIIVATPEKLDTLSRRGHGHGGNALAEVALLLVRSRGRLEQVLGEVRPPCVLAPAPPHIYTLATAPSSTD